MQKESYSSELLELDTETRTLQALPSTGGACEARAYHSCCAVQGTGMLYVLGGRNDSGYCGVAVWECTSRRWSTEAVLCGVEESQKLCQRAGHAALTLQREDSDYILICGGRNGKELYADVKLLKVPLSIFT